MTTAIAMFGLTPARSFSNEIDALVGIAAASRALMVAALGLAPLLSGCGGPNIRSDSWHFDPANRVLTLNAEVPRPKVSESAFSATATPSLVEDKDTRAPELAFIGMRSAVGSDLHLAAVLDTRTAPAGLWGGHGRPFDDSSVSGFFHDQIRQDLARAAVADYLEQPRLGVSRPDTDYTRQSAGALPARAWSMTVSGTKLFHDSDRATLMAYLPMRSSKVVRKVVGKIFQSEDAGSFVSDLQAVSLIARGRINTEFSYSTQFNKYSRLDAAASYRLNAHTASSRSDFLFGLYYKAEF